MRIGEIAEKTGLSVSNIRFYEKKGLIGPDRETESRYRNYTEEDLSRLQRIILYRKMDFSVELIGQILNGEIKPEDAFAMQLEKLNKEREMLISSIDLCSKMIKDQAFSDVDTGYYLSYVKEEESNGRVFEQFDDLFDDLSEFTLYDRYLGPGLLGYRVIPNRLLRVFWCLLYIVIPVIGILEGIFDKEGPRPYAVLFWLFWILYFGICFFFYRRKKRKNNLE